MSVHSVRSGPASGNPYETDVMATLATARGMTADRRLDTVSFEDGVIQQMLQLGGYTYSIASQTTNNDLETSGHESVIVGGNTIWAARFDTRVFKENMSDGMTPLAVLGFYANVQRAIDKKKFPVAGKNGAEDEPILMPTEGEYDEPTEGETPLVYTVINNLNRDAAPTIDRFDITEAITYGEAALFLAHRAGGWTEDATTFAKPNVSTMDSPPQLHRTAMQHSEAQSMSSVVNLADFRDRKKL